MFEHMIRIAEKREGLLQLELEVIEGNDRALALYKKMGFREYGFRPDAIRLKDGRMLGEILMMRKILKDGREILLSRKNLDEIHAAYASYVFSRLSQRDNHIWKTRQPAEKSVVTKQNEVPLDSEVTQGGGKAGRSTR